MYNKRRFSAFNFFHWQFVSPRSFYGFTPINDCWQNRIAEQKCPAAMVHFFWACVLALLGFLPPCGKYCLRITFSNDLISIFYSWSFCALGQFIAVLCCFILHALGLLTRKVLKDVHKTFLGILFQSMAWEPKMSFFVQYAGGLTDLNLFDGFLAYHAWSFYYLVEIFSWKSNVTDLLPCLIVNDNDCFFFLK